MRRTLVRLATWGAPALLVALAAAPLAAQHTSMYTGTITYRSGNAGVDGYEHANVELQHRFNWCDGSMSVSFQLVPGSVRGIAAYWYQGHRYPLESDWQPTTPLIELPVRVTFDAKLVNSGTFRPRAGTEDLIGCSDAAFIRAGEGRPHLRPPVTETQKISIMQRLSFSHDITATPLMSRTVESRIRSRIAAGRQEARQDSLARARQAQAQRDSGARVAQAERDSIERARRAREAAANVADRQRSGGSGAGGAGSAGGTGGTTAGAGRLAPGASTSPEIRDGVRPRGSSGAQAQSEVESQREAAAQREAEAQREALARREAAAERRRADSVASVRADQDHQVRVRAELARQAEERERQRQVQEQQAEAMAQSAANLVGSIGEIRRINREQKERKEAAAQRAAERAALAYAEQARQRAQQVAQLRQAYLGWPDRPRCTAADATQRMSVGTVVDGTITGAECQRADSTSTVLYTLEVKQPTMVTLGASGDASPQVALVNGAMSTVRCGGCEVRLDKGRYLVAVSGGVPGETGAYRAVAQGVPIRGTRALHLALVQSGGSAEVNGISRGSGYGLGMRTGYGLTNWFEGIALMELVNLGGEDAPSSVEVGGRAYLPVGWKHAMLFGQYSTGYQKMETISGRVSTMNAGLELFPARRLSFELGVLRSTSKLEDSEQASVPFDLRRGGLSFAVVYR